MASASSRMSYDAGLSAPPRAPRKAALAMKWTRDSPVHPLNVTRSLRRSTPRPTSCSRHEAARSLASASITSRICVEGSSPKCLARSGSHTRGVVVVPWISHTSSGDERRIDATEVSTSWLCARLSESR